MADYWHTQHAVNTKLRQYGVHDGALRNGGASTAARTMLPNELDAGASRVVGAIQGLFAATDMTSHCAQMPAFDRNLVWDAPPILIARKGYLRVAA
jgi:hypothetical protein